LLKFTIVPSSILQMRNSDQRYVEAIRDSCKVLISIEMNAAPDTFASAGESQADVPAIDDSQTKKFI